MKLVGQILNSQLNNLLFKKPIPIKITLALTFLCNSRCKICNIWKIYKDYPKKYKQELSVDEWKRFLREIRTDLGWIEFTGGEPLLKKEALDVVLFAYNNMSIYAGGIVTNAVFWQNSYDKINQILKEIPGDRILNVGISLDGISVVHDKIRGIEGNFEKAVLLFRKLRMLKKQYKNLNVHFAYTISQYNCGRFEEFYDCLKTNYGVNIDEITVTLEHFTAYYALEASESNNPYEPFKDKIKRDIFFYINALKVEKNFNIFNNLRSTFYAFYLKKMLEFIDNPKKMVIPCVAGTYSAYVDPYGNVYPCTQWNIKLGNLREKPFKEIWYCEKAKEVRKLIKNKKCPNCWTPCEAQPSWIINFGLLRGWW